MSRGSGALLALLRAARDFRLLVVATLVSSIGTWLAFVALVIAIYDLTGDATWVSALLVVEFLPIVAVGLFAGPLLAVAAVTAYVMLGRVASERTQGEPAGDEAYRPTSSVL